MAYVLYYSFYFIVLNTGRARESSNTKLVQLQKEILGELKEIKQVSNKRLLLEKERLLVEKEKLEVERKAVQIKRLKFIQQYPAVELL
jgi:hypothetical protein